MIVCRPFSGADLIWLDEVSCTGTESSLAGCAHDDWLTHDCDHSEDAGVICGQCVLKTHCI